MPDGRPRREKFCKTCGEADRDRFKHGHYDVCAACHNAYLLNINTSSSTKPMTVAEKEAKIRCMTHEIRKNNSARKEAYYGTRSDKD